MTNGTKAYLEVITGGMFAGKSTALISKGERHVRAGRKVVYCKPTGEDRYSADHIVTHSGLKVEAINLDSVYYKMYVEEWMALYGADVVLIDEAQFYERTIVGLIQELLERGKTVYVAGLDLDYTGSLFSSMAKLMALADTVTKLKAVCKRCGEDAFQSLRNSNEKAVKVIGGSGMYEPVCRECYTAAQTK